MKLFDIDGNLVTTNVRQSAYPVKHQSRSKLQGKVAEFLQAKYPFDAILEDFTIPGSRLSVDFFLPIQKIVCEIQGAQHDFHTPIFHGPQETSMGFANQKKRDRSKQEWAETNGFRFIEIRTEEDMKAI